MVSRFRAALGEDEGSETDSNTSSQETSGSGQAADGPEIKKSQAKRAKREIKLDDLQAAGFAVRSNILTIKEQQQDPSYEWGRGHAKEEAEEEDDFEERERLRKAANEATQAAIHQSLEHKQKAAELRAQERMAHAEKQNEKKDSYQQREKRKRELGQTKRATNYVEEEKRLLRQHNVYSGFD